MAGSSFSLGFSFPTGSFDVDAGGSLLELGALPPTSFLLLINSEGADAAEVEGVVVFSTSFCVVAAAVGTAAAGATTVLAEVAASANGDGAAVGLADGVDSGILWTEGCGEGEGVREV